MAKALIARALPLLLRALAACQRAGEDLAEQIRSLRPGPSPREDRLVRDFRRLLGNHQAARSRLALAEPEAVDGAILDLTAAELEISAFLRRAQNGRKLPGQATAWTGRVRELTEHYARQQAGQGGSAA